MADNFFSRWSQRKEAVRAGKEVVPEPAPEVEAGVHPPQPSPRGGGSKSTSPTEAFSSSPPSPGEGTSAPVAPPTLEEAQSLTADSDFSRFTRPDVTPEVKNAAMKKLFSDPHFNVMDGLDVYIDDYNKPDPLPPGMLRQMASAKFLKLFDEPEEKTPSAAPATGGDAPGVAQSGLCNDLPGPTDAASHRAAGPDDADPDLRLQQDDAPGPEGPGAGSR